MVDSAPDKLPTEALVALQSGRRIEAIRIVREQLGLGLKEARQRVEAAERARRRESAGLANTMSTKVNAREDSGTLRLIAVLVVLGALLAYFLL